jgi:hypothetical protein
LIHHLTTVCGGNVHARGVVEITCSSTACNKCWQVADHSWNSYWYTDNIVNSWIQFDFKNRSVSPSHYTLKSDGNGYHHLLEWTVAGSGDGASWDPIDYRKTQELNGNYITKTFALSVSSGTRFYRYIRLTQTGKDSNGKDYLLLAAVEFFGRMTHYSSLPL